jgi:hypothetical protein
MGSQRDTKTAHTSRTDSMKIKSFNFDDNAGGASLFVEGSLVDALRVVTAIQALDGTRSTKPVEQPKVEAAPQPKPQVEPVVAPPSPQPKLDPDTIARIAASSPQPPPKAEKPKRAAKAEAAEQQPEVAAEVPHADPPKAATEQQPLPQTTASPTPGDSDLPDNVRNATRIRDVISYFVKRGAKTFEEVLPELKRAQPHVPTLSSVSDLEGRAKRAWEVMDLADL